MKRNKLTKIVAIIIIGLFVFTIVAGALVSFVNASSLDSQLSVAKQERKKAEAQLRTVQSQKGGATAEKVKLDSEISSISSEISQLQKLIYDSDINIAQKQVELTAAQAKCDEQFESFKVRARIMYENGPSSYLEVIFGSKSFSEFITNIDIVKDIANYDKQILNERVAAKNVIEAAKIEIEKKREEQVINKQLLDEKKATVAAKQQAQAKIVSNLSAQEKEIQKKIKEQQQSEANIQNMIKQQIAEQSAQQSTVSSGSGIMTWPCPGNKYITSSFGVRLHPIDKVYKNHTGIDINASSGATIVAAGDGLVTFSGYEKSYGNMIVILHAGGVTTLYAHCSSLLVATGTRVTGGQTIAKVGSTGNSTGPHLHFEVSVKGVRQNPSNYVK